MNVREEWQASDMNDPMARALTPMILSLSSAGPDQWREILEHIDATFELVAKNYLYLARAFVVQIVATYFGALRRVELLYAQTGAWIDAVGNREVEENGLFWQGDYWHIHHWFRSRLDVITDIPSITLRDATTMQLADVKLMTEA